MCVNCKRPFTQAPRAWFSRLSHYLLQLGFISAKSDTSLFFKNDTSGMVFLLIYVDDIILTGTTLDAIQSVAASLHSQFALKDLGDLSFFLGIQATRTNNGLLLSQKRYITNLLNRTKMTDDKPIATPVPTSLKLSQHDGDPLSDPTLYHSVVGALQYLTITHPEISFAVNKVCQFMQTPREPHWSAVKRILRYLKGTCSFGLFIQPSATLSIHAYSDLDWAGCPDDRRSTHGYCVYLGPNLISWSAKKQTTTSRSSTEAEYRAIAFVTTELCWIRSLLNELSLLPECSPILWCDNIGATYLTANPVFHARTKHIEVDVHFVREKVAKGELSIRFISTVDQLADIMTKSLVRPRFVTLRSKLVVHDPASLEGA
ncbi:hypothetical protein DH2020_021449 [Rehmannia glutinosa]|uniref:Reverse transcriptase Ty1/copia-type domain-containing protein n=1 Tax=Rehmannia glutinosa TaxID=99300 RepID=A0ABR0WE86_REHGL